jgi:hypothetical protein
MTRPLNSEVLEYLERGGARASKVLSKLGQLDSHLHVNLETEFGREILKEDVDRLDILFEMVYNQKAKKEDFAEFKYLRDRINRLSHRLSLYNDGLKQITEDVNKK